MNRVNFDTLLDKYLTGTCSADEKKLVDQWYALLDNPDMIHLSDIDTLKNTIWAKIQDNTQTVAKVIPMWQRPVFRYFAAASVLFLISFGVYFFQIKEDITKSFEAISQIDMLQQRNTSDKTISLTLEDGSRIDLLPDAELTYPKKFGADKREVTLKGEAFFQITKNPSKPFYVYANQTITKVLGTSFTVRAFEQEKTVTVLVKTGKVSVYTATPRSNKHKDNADPETQGVVVTPNQKAIFDIKTTDLQKAVVEKPAVIIPLSIAEEFIFNDAPVSTIFDALEKTYGIDIVYDEELLKNCTLTTTLTDVPMFDKLKIICSAIGATYKEIDAHIVITAKGCK